MAGRRRNTPDGLGNARDYERLAEQSIQAFRQLDRRAQVIVLCLLLVAGVIAAAVYYHSQHAQHSHSTAGGDYGETEQVNLDPRTSPHLVLGNPSGARQDATNRDNYLLVKPFFALSYNDSNGTPNWVSWRVTPADLGDAPRKQTFDADTSLPADFFHVTHADYSNSGFDRGHMCPHGDRSANQQMSYATFVMSNIIPQAPRVNQDAWANLENYSRDLVRRDGNWLFIVAGPSGRGGVGTAGPASTIGHGRVAVPSACWKVIVVVPDATTDATQISASARVIAVIMPNDETAVGEKWTPFITSAAEVEKRTNCRFFDRVPPAVADALRNRVDKPGRDAR